MDAFLEWLSSNSLINYPFKENVTLKATDGFILPQDTILDLVISGVDADDRVHLSEMIVGVSLVTLKFASLNLGMDIISVAIPRTSLAVRAVFSAGDAPDDKYSVRVVPGESWPSLAPIFTHMFTLSATEIEPSAVMPEIAKVLSLDNLDSPYFKTPGRLTGVVYLADGCNMRVTLDEEDNSVTYDAAPGAGIGPCYECDEVTDVPRPIRTINGIRADERHNFKMNGSECIEIRMYPDINMIAVFDHCRPCCDCDRLVDFDTRLDVIESMLP